MLTLPTEAAWAEAASVLIAMPRLSDRCAGSLPRWLEYD